MKNIVSEHEPYVIHIFETRRIRFNHFCVVRRHLQNPILGTLISSPDLHYNNDTQN